MSVLLVEQRREVVERHGFESNKRSGALVFHAEPTPTRMPCRALPQRTHSASELSATPVAQCFIMPRHLTTTPPSTASIAMRTAVTDRRLGRRLGLRRCSSHKECVREGALDHS